MVEHIHQSHPGYSINGVDGAPLPSDMAHAMFVTAEEEHSLGIPKEQIPYKQPLGPLSAEITSASRRKRVANAPPSSSQPPSSSRQRLR